MRRIACLLFPLLGCTPGTHTTGFGVDPGGVQLATSQSSGEAGAGESSSSSSTGESTGEASVGGSSGEETTGLAPPPDFGPGDTPGCLGKIDFLFAISSSWVFNDFQEQMLEAIPAFYGTIEGEFAEFDTHVMVVETDDYWSVGDCTYCVDDCDPQGSPPLCGAEVDVCNTTMGAGVVFPAGKYASNRRCDLPEGRRYITREDPDPLATFECVAQIGSGGPPPEAGEAMFKAIGPELGGPGGCNEGFLRDDALLVVTIIAGMDRDSDGHIYTWTNKLLEAKQGDPDAFIVLVLSADNDQPGGICDGYPQLINRLRTFAEYVPHGRFGSICAPSYVPFFAESVPKILELCDNFIPG